MFEYALSAIKEDSSMISTTLVLIMVILATAAFVWCFFMENGRDDKDKTEKWGKNNYAYIVNIILSRSFSSPGCAELYREIGSGGCR